MVLARSACASSGGSHTCSSTFLMPLCALCAGVIALTRCASRSAGYAAAFWLMLAGVIAKFGAFILTIPDCVLGGMTTFLFANVIVSGIKVGGSHPETSLPCGGSAAWPRRQAVLVVQGAGTLPRIQACLCRCAW